MFISRSPDAVGRIGAWQLLLALALIWGTAFLFNRVAVTEISPGAVVAVRIAVAAFAEQ